MGEDWRQWEEECRRSGGRRIGGQREEEEACGRSVGVNEEACVAVIGIRYGNGRGKGCGKRGNKGVRGEGLEG